MIVTAALNGKATEEFSEAGKSPDFQEIARSSEGVDLIRVFGRNRYAELKVTEVALAVLKDRYGDKFIFAEQRRAQPF